MNYAEWIETIDYSNALNMNMPYTKCSHCNNKHIMRRKPKYCDECGYYMTNHD